MHCDNTLTVSLVQPTWSFISLHLAPFQQICQKCGDDEMANSMAVLGFITALHKCCLSEDALCLQGELIEPSE